MLRRLVLVVVLVVALCYLWLLLDAPIDPIRFRR